MSRTFGTKTSNRFARKFGAKHLLTCRVKSVGVKHLSTGHVRYNGVKHLSTGHVRNFGVKHLSAGHGLSLIHISEPTRRA